MNSVSTVSAAASMTGESMSVFAVAARRRVGDAAGNRHRRDVAVKIRLIDDLDCYMSVSQRGIISTWTNKVVNQWID